MRTLIREYVRSGRPVGSRRLSKIYSERLSPATLRNVMADLEEMGYLSQPHTSAGRVPTEKGYRFYVESLAKTDGLSRRELHEITESLEQETDTGTLMNKASHLLSQYSNNVGFVLAPPLCRAVMRHIEFVKLSDSRILVILVSGGGLTQHRIVRIQEDLSQEDLTRASNYLVTHFVGRTLMEIQAELLKLMSEAKNLYDTMLKTLVILSSASIFQQVPAGEEDSEVYLSGTAQMIQKPELADLNRMMLLFRTFEEKSRLVAIINECLKQGHSGPVVTIGLDKHIPGMHDWALITCPYLYDRYNMGGLGVLGPCRMEYEKTISLVDHVAKVFDQIFSTN